MQLSFGSKLIYLFEPGSWSEALFDVVVGSLTGVIRAFHVFWRCVYVNVVRPFGNLVGFQMSEGKRPKVADGKLKVAAVGFSRTGTYSVAIALEEMGYPTFHTISMYTYENEEILKMWSKNVVDPAIEKLEPSIGRADFKLIADSGYQAVADLPSIFFFEQILEAFPDCKFILTTRENSEVWYRSWQSLTKSITTSMHVGGVFFPTLRLYSRYLRWAYAVVNNDTSYLTSFIPKEENIKENAIATYEEHNRRVREVIPPDQLLEYSVKEGWDPLCKFLEIEECPVTPFPKSNSGGQLRAQSYSALLIGVILLFFLIRRFSKSFTALGSKKKVA